MEGESKMWSEVNNRSSRRERLSEMIGEGQIGEAISNARTRAWRKPDRKTEAIRDAAEGWESAPGDRTPRPRKKLTWKEKRQADKILSDGKQKKR